MREEIHLVFSVVEVLASINSSLHPSIMYCRQGNRRLLLQQALVSSLGKWTQLSPDHQPPLALFKMVFVSTGVELTWEFLFCAQFYLFRFISSSQEVSCNAPIHHWRFYLYHFLCLSSPHETCSETSAGIGQHCNTVLSSPGLDTYSCTCSIKEPPYFGGTFLSVS